MRAQLPLRHEDINGNSALPTTLAGAANRKAMMMVRVAVINTHPIQHFAPLWREIARLKEAELKVFYSSDWGITEYADPDFGKTFKWDIDLLSGYESEFLPISARPRKLGFWETDNPTVGKRLQAFQPDLLVLFGYSHLVDWRAILWAKRRGVRVLVFGDSELKHPRPVWRRFAKELVVRAFLALSDGALPIGNCNAQYYRRYGIPEERMYWCAWPVDGQRFLSEVGNPAETRAAVRSRLGIPGSDFVIATVGKYVARKRHEDVLRAWHSLPTSLREKSRVLVVGEGALRPQLAQLAAGSNGRVVLTGFVNQREIPQYYCACDALVVASEIDPHPLVVTESLFLGLPVIASDRIGCIGPDDTLRPDENGLVYPCGDVAALGESLGRLLTDPGLYARLSQRSRELALGQDAQAVAQKFTRAFRAAMRCPDEPWSGRLRRVVS